MSYEKQERELHLKDMVFGVLRRWRSILVLALVLALVMGGLKWNSTRTSDALERERAEYQQLLLDYQNTLAAKDQEADWLRGLVERQRIYMAESMMMSLDPTGLYRGGMDLYIVDADEAYSQRMLEGYRAALEDGAFLSDLAASLDIQPKYLKEILSVSFYVRELGDEALQFVRVIVYHSNLDQATAMLRAVEDALTAATADVTDAYGQHALVRSEVQPIYCVDNEIASRQWSEKERLTYYENALKKTLETIELLEEPNDPHLAATPVASGLQFGLIGLVLGLVLGCGLALLAVVFGDKLYSALDLSGRYDVKVLGTVAGIGKRPAVERLLDAMEGRVRQDDAQTNALLAAQIRSRCGQSDRLLLCGDEILARHLAEKLKDIPGLAYCADPCNDETALQALCACDRVVLVGVCGKSRYSQLAKMMDLSKDLDKPLLGCIIAEYRGKTKERS